MAASKGTVRVQRAADEVNVRVIGWGTLQHGLPLRRFAEQCVKEGARCVRVDLRECTYVDSTFLGTLLNLKRSLQRRGGRLVLLSPSRECQGLFQQMGVDHVFVTEGDTPANEGAWEELAGDMDDARAFNRTIVEAHEELANLEGTAGETFGRVAECLTRDWEEKTAARAEMKSAAMPAEPNRDEPSSGA